MGGKPVYHEVINQILSLIDSGEFPVGSRLPPAQELAIKFGVNRASIREAQIALEAQGRIDIKMGSGAYVLKDENFSSNGLPKVGAFELTEARVLFEVPSSALAAPMITDETIQELEHLISIISGEEKSDMSAVQADAAFHNTIARATNNRAIIFVIETMWKMSMEATHLKTVYQVVHDKEGHRHQTDHHLILKALKNRDLEAVRRAMQTHFTRMLDAFLVASEQEALEEIKRKRLRFSSNY